MSRRVRLKFTKSKFGDISRIEDKTLVYSIREVLERVRTDKLGENAYAKSTVDKK